MLNHQEPTRALPDPAIWPTMTVPWAARVLGVAPRTLYDAINRGEFECIRIGTRILIKTEWLVELLSSGSSDE